jgi:hypothetical protein
MPRHRKGERPHAVHGDVERTAALLDVHLLDVLAELESLLRNGREIQREALRIRGVPSPTTRAQRSTAARRLKQITTSMVRDHGVLGGILRTLRDHAADLNHAVRNSASK